MNYTTLGNILWSIRPDEGFGIYGEVSDESEFDSNVLYTNPSQKPSWGQVESGRNPEQWITVRGERNNKLASCDYTRLNDVPLTDEKKAEWETYRQELRDITDQPDPFNINWPTPPE